MSTQIKHMKRQQPHSVSALEEKLDVTKELHSVQEELLRTLQTAAFVQADTENTDKLNKNLQEEVDFLTKENKLLKSLLQQEDS